MRAARLMARRSGTRRSLLLSLFAVVGIASFLLAGIAGYVAGTADSAVRETVAGAPAKAQSIQLSTRLADDSEQQADAIEQLIAGAFTDTDVAVHRSVRSNPAAARVGERAVDLILLADPQLAEHATLVSGEWPRPTPDTNPVAVQATAADELGLEVGDRFTVEGTPFEVHATWRATDATDPYWFADPAVASGFEQLSLGPIVVAESAMAELPVRNYAQWTIVPGPASLTAEGLPALAGALDSLALDIERTGDQQSIQLRGTLPDSVDSAQRGLGVASALVLVPGVLVAVIGLITLAQLARLLVSVRRSQTVLLRARGASVTQLTVVSVLEAAVAIVPGSALGAGVAIGLLTAGLSATGMIPLGIASMIAAAWPMALAVAGVALLACGVVSWRAALGATGPTRDDSGRARSSVTTGAAVLVLVAAAVSLWQFKLYGSPLVVGQDGTPVTDPLVVVAPALVLVALALVGLLAFSPIARLLERWAARVHGILPVLPGRQVARRAPVFGVALLLITLAVSGTTLTAVYSQTWTATSRAASQLGNGADVRIQLSPETTVEAPAPLVSTVPYLRLPGTTDAATVLRTPVRVARDSVGLTAIAATRLPDVVHRVDGSVDPVRIAAAIGADRTGVAADGHDLRLTAMAEGSSTGSAEIFAWLEDADGSLALVPLGSVALAETEPVTVSAELPEGRDGEWTVLALEATLSAADGARDVELTLAGLDQDYRLILSSVEPTARAVTFPAPTELPVVVTDPLASRLSLEAGSAFNARIPSTASTLDAVVAGTTPAIPAADGIHGMVVDLPTLNRYLLATSERIPQADEVWASIEPGAELAAAAAAVSTTSATITATGDGPGARLVAPAIVALWWGTAGALLLAALALFAITSTFLQDRRGEVVILRALGVSSSQQGRNRLLELVGVVGGALVTGVVTGLVASVLTVQELATAADASAPVALRFDLLGWSALVFALLVVVVTISSGYARRVGRQARDTEHRGETR